MQHSFLTGDDVVGDRAESNNSALEQTGGMHAENSDELTNQYQMRFEREVDRAIGDDGEDDCDQPQMDA